MQIGARYYGSPSLEVSTDNHELVPDKVSFYKFSFAPSEDCTVKINNSSPILIRADLGFSMNETDAFISSFIIVESGIEFSWIGGSK